MINRTSTRLACSLVLITLAVVASFSQEKKISREQYFDAINAAGDKSSETYPRQLTSSRKIFNEGSVNSWQTTEEHLSSTKFKKTVQKTENGKTVSNQYVRVGAFFYCKSGKAAWKKSRNACEPIEMTMSPPPNSETFSVKEMSENGQKIFVYRMYTTRFWPMGANATEYFFEQISTLSDKGHELSWSVTSGKTKGKEITDTSSGTYLFDITSPTIEAPIK